MMKCVIIEDEPPARKVLAKYIDDIPFLKLSGEFANAMEAMEKLNSGDVDILFLDINLPKISGLNFLRSLQNPPKVIITTAYSEYALEGFELDVVDYLLKPISFERFMKAVSKIKQQKSPETGETSQKSSNEDEENNHDLAFTFVKSDNSMYRIDFDDIRYIESDEDYVDVKTEESKYHLRNTLKYWNNRLPDHKFVRVHKSFIVNISKIEHISGNRIIMKDTNIPIGRSYKKRFFEMVENLM